MSTQEKGKQGEALAAAYLEKKKCRILARNYRCRMGEIDLIAQKDGMILFVEVKLRKNDAFSSACEAVDLAKQNRLRITAARWLAEQKCQLPARFDVIEIYTDDRRIHHIPDAFQ